MRLWCDVPRRWPVAALLTLSLAACAAPPVARPPTAAGVEGQAAFRGEQLVRASCAGCHAVGRADASPLLAAPPLREVARRRDLGELETELAEGLVTAHPDMPAFAWRAAEIDDLIVYLDRLRTDPPRRD